MKHRKPCSDKPSHAARGRNHKILDFLFCAKAFLEGDGNKTSGIGYFTECNNFSRAE